MAALSKPCTVRHLSDIRIGSSILTRSLNVSALYRVRRGLAVPGFSVQQFLIKFIKPEGGSTTATLAGSNVQTGKMGFGIPLKG